MCGDLSIVLLPLILFKNHVAFKNSVVFKCFERLCLIFRLSESSDSMDFHPPLPPTPGRQLSENLLSPHLAHRSASLDSAVLSDGHPGSATGNKSGSFLPPLFNDAKSGEDELEAVEALLSIKKSHPSVSPVLSKQDKKKRRASDQDVRSFDALEFLNDVRISIKL